MPTPAKDFVRQVITHLHLDDNPRQGSREPELFGADALAQELGKVMVSGRPSYGTVRRWLKGQTAPEYEPTMAMLELCGWLNMKGEAQPQEPPRGRLEELVDGFETVAQEQSSLLREALQELAETRRALRADHQEPPRDDPESSVDEG